MLAGELEVLVDPTSGGRGDERRRGDLGRRDRRHGERAADLHGERLVEEAEDDPGLGVQVAGGQAGVEVREVVAGGEDDRPRPCHASLFERLERPAVAADHGDLQVDDLVEQRRVGRWPLDGDTGSRKASRPLMIS